MCTYSQWFLLVASVCIIDAQFTYLSFTTIHSRKMSSKDAVFNDLDNCWNKKVPAKGNGMQSSAGNLHKACRAFNTGMECFGTWSKTCLLKKQHELESIITKSRKIYKLFCTDAKYRQKDFQHWNCYQRISPYWTNCNRIFDTLKPFNNTRSKHRLCCIRLAYNRCVMKFTTGLCSNNATKYLQSFLQSLTHSSFQPLVLGNTNVNPGNDTGLALAESSTDFYILFLLIFCAALRSITIQAFPTAYPFD